jgi:hypothetical protein
LACAELNSRVHYDDADEDQVFTKSLSESDDDDYDSDSDPSNCDTTTLGGYSTTATNVDLSTLSVMQDNDSDSIYTGYSANGSCNSSMNTSASFGGARLSADPNDDEGSWQTAPSTRVRRGVASSTGANSTGVSAASTVIIINTPRAHTFDKNAYGKPKTTSSVANFISSSNWMSPPCGVAHTSSRKFAKVKAHKSRDDEDETIEAFKSIAPVSEDRILDPDWQDSDASSSEVDQESEEDDNDTE